MESSGFEWQTTSNIGIDHEIGDVTTHLAVPALFSHPLITTCTELANPWLAGRRG